MKCATADHSSSASARGKRTHGMVLYGIAATLSLTGARRDVHQDILMAGKPKGKGNVFGGNCLTNVISFPLLLTQSIASLQSDVKNGEQNTN